MEKFSEKIKKFFSSDESLKRIPLYFLLTCVLLVILLFKLGETNHYLKEIAANGTNAIEVETKDETNEDVADIYIKTTKTPEDYIPMLEELTDDTTTTKAPKETTTKRPESTKVHTTNVTTTQPSNNENKNDKTTYVLNISSKKIHLPECSFVDRTKEENKKTVELTEEELQEYLNNGYTFCKTCGGD